MPVVPDLNRSPKMSTETATPRIWPLPVAIALTVAIFTATFYCIAEGVRLQEKKGIWPIAVGVSLFAVLMLALSAVTFRKDGKWRVGLSIAVVLGETAVFTYCLFFLLLNIFGS